MRTVSGAAGTPIKVACVGIVIAGCGNGASAYFQEASDHETKQEWHKAIAAFDKAIEFDPGHAAAYAGRCNALRMTHQLDRALRDCDKAIELDADIGVIKEIRLELGL